MCHVQDLLQGGENAAPTSAAIVKVVDKMDYIETKHAKILFCSPPKYCGSSHYGNSCFNMGYC